MTNYFWYFLGASALSDFRTERLHSKLSDLDTRIESVSSNYFYLVNSSEFLDHINQKLLANLLESDEKLIIDNNVNDIFQKNDIFTQWMKKIGIIDLKLSKKIFITPRIGTISPWSSKATDIIQRCISPSINRVERGILYILEYRLNKNQQLHIEHNFAFSRKTQTNLDSNISDILYDRMTESLNIGLPEIKTFFSSQINSFSQTIDIRNLGKIALENANNQFGWALSHEEITYLYDSYTKMDRNPTDSELTMFAQANSEHCRHKIFNASWVIDGIEKEDTLFQMIKHTEKMSPSGTILAYVDNAAILKGNHVDVFFCDKNQRYNLKTMLMHIVAKVETHNHPTAISPFSGAATGVGGEIRDEGATGRGAYSKAGISGYICSHLYLPNLNETWENGYDAFDFPHSSLILRQLSNFLSTSANDDPIGLPKNIATPYSVMKDAPIGAASFGNEFGRPLLLGFFRVYEQKLGEKWFGFHKPLMLAGGLGNIDAKQAFKKNLSQNTVLIQIGGPGMRIGLGGGAASSLAAGMNTEDNDFASVQRANPEMQRRAQQVIDTCWQLGDKNPILSIHDVGAGGLSNAFPELIEGSKMGGDLYLDKIPIDEAGMSPREIWSNEAQERYVLGISKENINILSDICKRERCPYAIVGEIKPHRQLRLLSLSNKNLLSKNNNTKSEPNVDPVNIPLDLLFSHTPKTIRYANIDHTNLLCKPVNLYGYALQDLGKLIHAVLRHPSVASKSFLIHIADRTVGGLTVRDQFVGPWQIPTSDYSITAMSFNSYEGEVMAIGERAPIAVISPSSSVRMAIGEVVTNIAASGILKISDIKISANWMAACNKKGEDSALFSAVYTAAIELCPKLGLSIPVGKDSLSMQTSWNAEHSKFRRGNIKNNYKKKQSKCEVISPVTLIATAFASISNVCNHLTPQLVNIDAIGKDFLILIDLGRGKNRLGGSILAQSVAQLGRDVPDLDDPEDLKNFFNAIKKLNSHKFIHAYHDRSDGGLITTVLEMAFTGKIGVSINLDTLFNQSKLVFDRSYENEQKILEIDFVLRSLFSEELGAVIQIAQKNLAEVLSILQEEGVSNFSHIIGSTNKGHSLEIFKNGKILFKENLSNLERSWSIVGWQIARDRDNPQCADREYKNIDNYEDPGLSVFIPKNDKRKFFTDKFPAISLGVAPRVAILREQGSNSQKEMAFAFEKAGFAAFDIHMTDLDSGKHTLDDFVGLAIVGGFSFGDVLGAGRGWAKTILHEKKLNDMFANFFDRKNTFALGVCNGCQMMAHLSSIIPGAEYWPTFTRNLSEQFEARLSLVEIVANPSMFLSDLAGYHLPIVSSHGEGFANFSMQGNINLVSKVMHYINHQGEKTENYPFNPNGSPLGIAAVTNQDGRFTIMMPHPERTLRAVTTSYYPKIDNENYQEFTPWFDMFLSARKIYN